MLAQQPPTEASVASVLRETVLLANAVDVTLSKPHRAGGSAWLLVHALHERLNYRQLARLICPTDEH